MIPYVLSVGQSVSLDVVATQRFHMCLDVVTECDKMTSDSHSSFI